LQKFLKCIEMEYTIQVEKDAKSGWFVGQCEQLPEAISQGENIDDLMENMKDAIETVLDYKKELFMRTNKAKKTVKSLIFKHEADHIIKTPKRKRVYA